jgi:hypothetical protein
MADDEQRINKALGDDFKELGDTGLDRSGGFVRDEFLRQLEGERAKRVYREMRDNDPVIGAFLFAIEQLMRQSSWYVQPADDSDEAVEAADFVDGALFRDMSHSWEDTIAEITTMLPFGFAPMEIVWKRRNGPGDNPKTRSRFEDNLIAPRKLTLRAQETVWRWEFDEDGGIQGLYQQPPTGAELFVPIEKLLLFRTSVHKNNPEGRSILRNAYRPWYFKKRVEEIEGIGVERDLAGLPLVRIPADLFNADPETEPEKAQAFQTYKDLATKIRRDQKEGVVLPSTRYGEDGKGERKYDLELLSTGGRRQFDTSAIIDRYDKRIATVVLADFIFLGQDSVGSFALSSDKTAMFGQALGAWLDTITATINRHLIPRMWRLNGLPEETMPMLQHGDVEKPNLDELGNFVSKIAGAGALLFPNRELENALLRSANLPEMAEEDEMETNPNAAIQTSDEDRGDADET